MGKRYNYVYLIKNKTTGKKYIGSRGSDIIPLTDIKRYKTSQDKLKIEINKNITNFEFVILSEHESRDLAYIEESRLHNLYNVDRNNEYYNKSIQSSNLFTTANKVNVKDINGEYHFVNTDDARIKSGELTYMFKNKVSCYDDNGIIRSVDINEFYEKNYDGIVKNKVNCHDKDFNIVNVSVDDERIKSGELTYMFKNKIVAKDINDNIFHIDAEDDRYLSGELVGIAKNKILVLDESGSIKLIDKNNADNYITYASTMIHARDLEEKVHYIKRDDPRYLSGELIHFSKNKVSVIDKNGNTSSVYKDDPRYLSGELVSIMKNKIIVKDCDKNIISIDKDDPRYLSGELVSIMKNLISVKDKNGKTYKVNKDDPRYLSGELLPFAKNMVNVKNKDGKYKLVAKDDPRYLSGELTMSMSNKVVVKDLNGVNSVIAKDDPRYLSGELISANTKYKISIEGTIYPSIKFASLKLEINESTLKNRLNNKNFVDWIKICY